MPRIFTLFCVVLFAQHPLLTQTPLELGKITIEEGLPQGYIVAMCQDQEGFMWFGTNDGLCRYDGYEFLTFRHDPYDPFSISHNGITQIAELETFLCISTFSSFDLMDRQTRRFYHLNVTFKGIKGRMLSDGRQTLYFSNAAGSIQQLVLTEALIRQLRDGKQEHVSLPLEELIPETGWQSIKLSEDKSTLWLLRGNGQELGRFDLATRRLQLFKVPQQPSAGYLSNDGANGIWLGRSGALLHFNAKNLNDPWHTVQTTRPMDRLFHFDPIQQLLWLDLDGTSGYHFDLDHLPSTINPQQATVRLDIPEGVVSSLTDHSGMIWFGTNAHGIRQFNPRAAVFKNYLPGLSIYGTPFMDALGDVWLGRINRPIDGGLTGNRLDVATGLLQPYPFSPLIANMFALYTVADDAGGIWTSGKNIGSSEGKLIYYEPKSGRSEVYEYPVEPQRYFDVLVLRYETPASIWIYLPYKMMRFDLQTKQFESYDYSQLTTEEQSVMAVASTADGSKWIGLPTSILRAQPDGKGGYHYSKLQNDPGNRNSLPLNNIKSLLTDPTDAAILWIGTGGGGLSRLDTKTGLFTQINTQNGLPNDVVYGIVPELTYGTNGTSSSYNLWLSTNKGLAKFNPSSLQFQYFLQSDGLPGNEFNTYSYGKMADGRLVFGGVNGLTVFNPKDLTPNNRPPQARLTALRINGIPLAPRDSSALLTRAIEFTEVLELSYTQNNLLFQFAALDYAKPERNQFKFYLEGAETEWAHQGYEHSAQYLNLAPGTYTFKVKAANSDGVWNDMPCILKLVIHPPWYASWWAYTLYVLMAACAGYGFYRFQLRRRLEHAETKRLQELDQVKTRLYTNITHEFRTPLTVILGVTEQVKQFLAEQHATAQEAQLTTVQRNSSQLLQLINQLLDLSKLEAGRMALQLEHGDIVGYTKYLSESFHSYAASHNIQVHFLSDLPRLQMDYDPEKIQMIVGNLLSNAIKFTPPGGHIYVQLHQVEQKNTPWLSMQVKDTGVGIASEQLPFVFDRFYQADDSTTRTSGGTGIGLALVRELVKLMQGDIQVSSKLGAGAAFTVLLPLVGNSRSGAEVVEISPPAKPIFSFPEGYPALDSTVRVEDGFDQRPLLLIVEDHADVAEYIAACIHDRYQVILAHNGASGISMALESIPDLIISDVMMPEKDGFEVCAFLKNDERTSHIPIVLLTAKASVDDRIAGLRRGADAYLSKPFHPEELRAVLSNLLELRQKLQLKYSQWATDNEGLPLQSFGQQVTANQELDIEDAFLQKLRTTIESRISESDLSVEMISKLVGMSYPVVHRKVTALTGKSLTLYVRSVRLQKARILLADPTLTISEVAFQTGFNDPKFFSRVFSEAFGMPPTTYRNG